MNEIKTAFNRGRDELADALRALPDSIGKSGAGTYDVSSGSVSIEGEQVVYNNHSQIETQSFEKFTQEVNDHKEREIE